MPLKLESPALAEVPAVVVVSVSAAEPGVVASAEVVVSAEPAVLPVVAPEPGTVLPVSAEAVVSEDPDAPLPVVLLPVVLLPGVVVSAEAVVSVDGVAVDDPALAEVPDAP
jgi:hypothetical protein